VGCGHLLALAAAATGLPAGAAAVAAVGIEFSPAGHLALADPSGTWLSAEMRRAAVPAGWLAVLTARDANGRSRSAVILPDAIEPEAFRRLRVWLKWRDAAPQPEAGRSK
jgi:hypothetical protein